MVSSTAVDGLLHALAAVAASSPSRSSTASYAPVLAPLGTAARASVPSSRATSTSTVGLPRESRISRAPTASMEGTVLLLSCSGRSGVAGEPTPAPARLPGEAPPRGQRRAGRRGAPALDAAGRRRRRVQRRSRGCRRRASSSAAVELVVDASPGSRPRQKRLNSTHGRRPGPARSAAAGPSAVSSTSGPSSVGPRAVGVEQQALPRDAVDEVRAEARAQPVVVRRAAAATARCSRRLRLSGWSAWCTSSDRPSSVTPDDAARPDVERVDLEQRRRVVDAGRRRPGLEPRPLHLQPHDGADQLHRCAPLLGGERRAGSRPSARSAGLDRGQPVAEGAGHRAQRRLGVDALPRGSGARASHSSPPSPSYAGHGRAEPGRRASAAWRRATAPAGQRHAVGDRRAAPSRPP